MIKYLFCIIVFIQIGCSSTQLNYPDEIKEKGIQDQFNIAKYELYKLWHYCIEYGEGIDNLSNIPAEQDLNYIGLEQLDSLYGIIFEFENGENLDFLDKCTKYNGIGFKKSSNEVQLIFIQDGVYIDGKRINRNPKYDTFEEVFLKYLNENENKINPWLKDYVRLKGEN